MKTTIHPFTSRPSVSVSCSCDVYRVVAALGINLGTKTPATDCARRKFALARIAYSLAGVRRGSESATAWARRAQKQIDNVIASLPQLPA